jgi:signal transduction histidine kinase
VQLTIQDDGIGFDPGSASLRGLGLLGIQERVRELDGKVRIVSQPQKGTILEVAVPIGTGVSAG